MLPLHPAGPLGFLLMELRRRVAVARQEPERGASAIEWVIITGVLVALAVAVGFAIFTMVSNEASSISVPDLPGGGGGVGGGGNP